jgi:hypothetical protein
MPFDPTLPANNSPIVSAELRYQFNGLKALIDAQQTTIDAQQATINDNSVNIGDLLNNLNQLQIAFDNYVASHP